MGEAGWGLRWGVQRQKFNNVWGSIEISRGVGVVLKNPFCGEGKDILWNCMKKKNNHLRNHYIIFIKKIE